jgi:hypothetical protein
MSMLARLAAALAALAFAVPALAETPIPRAADGKPSFNGMWTNASLTGLNRPAGVDKLVVSEEEAMRIAKSTAIAGINPEDGWDADRTDPNEGAPPKGSQDFGLKGYNSFWVAPGERLARVKGEYRTSYIVEPANGRLPFKDAASIQRERSRGAIRYLTGVGGNEGPEATNLAERCLIGFGSTGGPGMLSVLYNNTYQFVQTPGHMMILVEMVHEARIVPIFESKAAAQAGHRPAAIKPWLGDTVGWWEGDTFVMQTKNVRPEQAANHTFPLSEEGVVTERLTRISADEIFYEFSVEDPNYYSQPWRAELSFYATEGPVYEYACHEGNYAMPGILLGARLQEAAAAESAGGRGG